MPHPEPTDDRARRRADLTRRAVAAAVAVAREHGLRVDEPVVLNDQFLANAQTDSGAREQVAGWSGLSAEVEPRRGGPEKTRPRRLICN